MKKRLFLSLVLVLLAAALVFAGMRKYRHREGLRFVKQLGQGINLGNCLDAYGASKYMDAPTVEDYETFWNNPPISKTLLRGVKEAGFDLVRIPVTWEEHLDKAGKVDSQWMDRVEEVVRGALDLGLTVILDAHHEEWLDLSGNAEKAEARFAYLWEQIALRFADCGEKLLFEGVNEPRLRDSALEWTGGDRKLRLRVERLNRVFVDTVRASGELNARRWLLLATYANGTEEEALAALTLPDRRCIVSLHLYETYDFCQREGGASQWEPDGEDAQKLLAICENVRKRFTRRDIPVIFTECGCVDKHNEADRVLWTMTLREGAKRCSAPCVWWDNGSTYRLLDRKTGKPVFSALLRAFLKKS